MIISRKRFEEDIYNRLEKERREMALNRAFEDIHREHERDISRLELMIAKLEETIRTKELDPNMLKMRMLKAEGAIHELQQEVKKNGH